MSTKDARLIKHIRLFLMRARVIICIVLSLTGFPALGQNIDSLSIFKVYELGRNNYPLIKQRNLISKTKEYVISNAFKGYLPALSINGQATYQSDVTSFPFNIPIAGFKQPQYDKDQYKVYGQIDQVIYDGGQIKNQKQTAEANEKINQQSLETQLYALYERLNQLFFGTLLLNEQIRQNELLQKDIQNGIAKAQALVSNGLAYRSSVDELSAQLLQAEQQAVQLQTTKSGFLQMLSHFLNRTLNENTKLASPPVPALAADSIARPELLTFAYQKKSYDLQDELLKVQIRPRLGFFFQGGYGRPGLNVLKNEFAGYYIGGIRLSWNLASLYMLKNQHRLINLGRQTLDIQRETFVFNIRQAQSQQDAEIQKYMQLIKRDQQIINLRNAVKNAATAQLQNGVLSAHDYIGQVNAEDEARQNLILHQVQLLQAQYSYQNLIGNVNPGGH